jgi:uncharacterized protein YbjT (DUF2867 family)
MKILVCGATGQTGQSLVPLLLAADFDVSVFVRSPQKLGALKDKLTIMQGDARDAESLKRAVAGQDVIMSTFGTRSMKKSDIQETFMRNLVAAMKANNVKRLINLSARGAGDSYEGSGISFKLMQATILKQMYADKNLGEALLLASDIDYTLVRPGRLTNGSAKGNVKASLDGVGLSTSISRQDVARFMVSQLDDKAWIRKAPLIGY